MTEANAPRRRRRAVGPPGARPGEPDPLGQSVEATEDGWDRSPEDRLDRSRDSDDSDERLLADRPPHHELRSRP